MPATVRPIVAGRESMLTRQVAWVRCHARVVGFFVFVALSFIWFASTWVDPLHRHAGPVGDPESYLFALSWPPFAVAHHMNPFLTTYLLAPNGANLMWQIPPGFGLLLWPVAAGLLVALFAVVHRTQIRERFRYAATTAAVACCQRASTYRRTSRRRACVASRPVPSLVAPWTTDYRTDLSEAWQALARFRFRMPSGYVNVPFASGELTTGVIGDRLERAMSAITAGVYVWYAV